MFRDARSISSGETIESDVCIVGAGAAGIAMARALIGRPYRVAVLESGGIELDEATQALADGANIGRAYFALQGTRLRFFGGTTNHWGGLCRPLDAEDFEQRDWVPYSGWPVTRAELDPYYERARPVCGARPSQWEREHEDDPTTPKLPLDAAVLGYRMAQASATWRFGRVFREELERAENVTVVLHANATEIVTAEGGRSVDKLDVAVLSGPRFSVRAKIYVLAMGGIENARLLLLSTRANARGVGNDHDLVGRFFLEHPRCLAAEVRLEDPTLSVRIFDLHRLPGGRARRYLCIQRDLQRKHRMLDVQLRLEPVYAHQLRIEGIDAWNQLWDAVRHGERPENLGAEISRLISHSDQVAGALARRSFELAPTVDHIQVFPRVEAAPNPDSRVTLGDDLDALGQRRVQLAWRLLDLDLYSAGKAVEILALELGKARVGRLQMKLDVDSGRWPDDTAGGWHHMGGTRMSDDPHSGVVDRNCRVHGIANLFVAGSSVFPTAGSGTPTLTLVALALRLADHVDRELQTEVG